MTLTVNAVRRQGQFDKKSRFEFTDSRVGHGSHCAVCGCSVRTPSAAWPFSVYKHAFTQKHAQACLAAGIVTESDTE